LISLLFFWPSELAYGKIVARDDCASTHETNSRPLWFSQAWRDRAERRLRSESTAGPIEKAENRFLPHLFFCPRKRIEFRPLISLDGAQPPRYRRQLIFICEIGGVVQFAFFQHRPNLGGHLRLYRSTNEKSLGLSFMFGE
jgi:hypothetical protein